LRALRMNSRVCNSMKDFAYLVRYHYAVCSVAQMVFADLNNSSPNELFTLMVHAFDSRLAELEGFPLCPRGSW
jgi:hypothetical protein